MEVDMGIFSRILSLLATWALLFVAMPTMATEPPPLPNLSEDISNLQLKALRDGLPHFERHGAQLVAISPQTPDRSLAQLERDGHPFAVLSDLDDSVMKAYKLYFELPEDVRALYVESFDLDITAYNGPGRHGLPVPGTLVVDRDGIVRASFADTDYKKRMEPAAILEVLEGL
jgi:peroxiredoxin